MTIEIRELVIEARVSDASGSSAPWRERRTDRDKDEEARWIALISQRVMEQLREEWGRYL
ncbi:DUF5908 family protein [Pluralibacter sp.]|jgi:hypothetical protein|uniref:DUF5908 family protein n=1 Tax=Pluralibacter sp. TaxID=1920032 RepID=UPI0025E0D1DA|nr:DUF5908 family protein [Pluralibacter sp.]MBV8042103.1 hypothetical protein [Pluralibacter sp.]